MEPWQPWRSSAQWESQWHSDDTQFDHKIELIDPNKIHYQPPFPMPVDRERWLRAQYADREAM